MGQNAIEYRDLIETAFPIRITVTASAEEILLQTGKPPSWDLAFEFELPVFESDEGEDPTSPWNRIFWGLIIPGGLTWIVWNGFVNGTPGYRFGRSWSIYVPLPPFEEAIFLVGFAAGAVFLHLNYLWLSWGWFDILRRFIVRLAFVVFCVAHGYVFVYACMHFERPGSKPKPPEAPSATIPTRH